MSIYMDIMNAFPKNDYQNQKRLASAKVITILNFKSLMYRSNNS